MTKIGILNSGGYNINSIRFALERLRQNDIIIVKNKSEFDACDKIIIPGVGNAKVAMEMLQKQNLINCIKSTQKPVLGICLGMQILCDFSQEFDTKCLGIFDEKVVHLPDDLVSPQMGWNCIENGKYQGEFVYFCNNFYVPICKNTTAFVDYFGTKISAIIQKDNFTGMQFHPEKSGKVGEKMLDDWLKMQKNT